MKNNSKNLFKRIFPTMVNICSTSNLYSYKRVLFLCSLACKILFPSYLFKVMGEAGGGGGGLGRFYFVLI